MTVDTHAQTAAVIDEGRLFEIRKIAFVDAHLSILLVVRGYAAIGDAACSDRVVADIDEERTIARPTAITVGCHRDAEPRAAVLAEQLAPLFHGEVGILTSNMHAAATVSIDGDINTADTVISHCKVQRCHIHRNGYTDVVREDIRLTAYLTLVGRLHVATDEQQPAKHTG